MIRSDGGDACITIVAGPATQWAEVRETMRQDGLIEASRSAPDALDAMMNAPGVAVAGHGGAYPAIILTPTEHRSEEHTSELQSLMRISYAVFSLKQKNKIHPLHKTAHKIT